MKLAYSASMLITVLIVALLSGCGAGGTSPETKNVLHESTVCFSANCHQDAKSLVTNENIVTEWKRSSHMTANVAGCADCHDDAYMHPVSCTKCHNVGGQAKAPTNNPDRDGKCAKCHNINNTNGAYSTNRDFDGTVTDTHLEHFSDPTQKAYTSGAFNARYVTKNYEKSCRSCHNPHDTRSNMDKLRQWARSGKGDVTALPWSNYDFGRDPARSTATPGATPINSFGADCVRCHTTTGYVNFLTNKSIGPAYGNTSRTDGKETLACNACHTDYSYARRPVGQVTAYYNKSTATTNKMRIRIAVTYPDIGESNMCLNCHVGRENGQVIKELAIPVQTANKVIPPVGTYNFANNGFENSHYLTAGATIFRKSGFEFYSSQYYNDLPNYAHDKIGRPEFGTNTGSSGPCITCHMKPGNHTFLPVTTDSNNKTTAKITGLTSTVCSSCHDGVTATSFSKDGHEIEHEKEMLQAAMDALRALLQEKLNLYFSTVNPYFFTSTYNFNYVETYNNPPSPTNCAQNQAVKNWQTGGTSSFAVAVSTNPLTGAVTKSCRSTTVTPGLSGTGSNNMGAAFNYNLFFHDYGAFAHNKVYVKRLIYDSIRYLSNNSLTPLSSLINKSVETAIWSSTSLTDPQKNAACKYLFDISIPDSPGKPNSGYIYNYIKNGDQNWRPGSDYSNPLY